MKTGQGWQYNQRMFWIPVAAILTFLSINAQASTLSIRDIAITGKNQVSIQFDGALAKNNLNLDYVRDNVQFSFENTTIYPAKMIHAESSLFNKIFAYQYSPNLVRIRFTVNGQAEQYRGKMRWAQNGKTLSITFPDVIATAVASEAPEAKETKEAVRAANETNKNTEITEQKEKALLSKIMKEEVAAVATTAIAPKNEKNKKSVAPTSTALGGAKAGPSLGRSFLAMFLIVGGLGAVLFFVKRKKSSLQAKVIGKTWWSNLLPSSMRKPKSFIEVMGTHALGPKQSIVVVRIKGQQFVLGVTQDNVQLITQLDEDEAEVDVLGDPAVSESIGLMFGARPTQAQVTKTSPASFNALLSSSTGANAIIGRNAYQTQAPAAAEIMPIYTKEPVRVAAQPEVVRSEPSVRDQIRRHLETRNFEDIRNA